MADAGVGNREIRRVGPTEKCPACGVSVDAEAYRCPRCLIYFCFKCRRRVQKDDRQYQCVNQKCGYHGKLLCGSCTREIVQSKEVPSQETVSEIVVQEQRMKGAWRYILGGALAVVAAAVGISQFVFTDPPMPIWTALVLIVWFIAWGLLLMIDSEGINGWPIFIAITVLGMCGGATTFLVVLSVGAIALLVVACAKALSKTGGHFLDYTLKTEVVKHDLVPCTRFEKIVHRCCVACEKPVENLN